MGHLLKPVAGRSAGGRTTAFEGRAPLLHRSDVGDAFPIARPVLTSARARITWGVPVDTGRVVAIDYGGLWLSRGRGLPREPRSLDEGEVASQPRVLGESAGRGESRRKWPRRLLLCWPRQPGIKRSDEFP